MPRATPARTVLPHTKSGRKGGPVALLHGFGLDRTNLDGLVERIAPLRRTIAFDLPAHGEAGDWSPAPDVSVCARAVCDSLDALKVERAVLIGHSLGGAVASLAALKRPDLVERLILIAPGGFGTRSNVRLLVRYANARKESELEAIMENFFGNTSKAMPGMAARAARQRQSEAHAANMAAIGAAMEAPKGQGTLPLGALGEAPFATTVIWGAEDAVLPVSHLANAPPQMARHVLPDLGHMPHLEAPDLVAEIVLKAILGRLPDG